MQFVLEAAASSCKFDLITEYEGAHEHATRGIMHAMIVMPFGTGKTSNFLDISKATYAYDVTFPGLIGSINKAGEVIESTMMHSAGKVIVIDEFQKLTEDVQNAMNSLLEYPHRYSRSLGYKIASGVSRNGKYYSLQADTGGNEIRLFARFACIAGGMFVKRRSTISKAWFSRFVPSFFVPSVDYYEKMSKGEKIVNVKPVEFAAKFDFRDYIKFNELYWKTFKASPFANYFVLNPHERGYIVRAMQDIVRMSAYIASREKRTEITIEDAELAMRVFPFMFSSYEYTDLDELDMFIIGNINTLTRAEVASRFATSTKTIKNRVSKLTERGFIGGDKVGLFGD
jgi:hypothetical protein